MLDDNLKTQLKAHLEMVREPFEIIATLGSDKSSQEMKGLLEDIASLSSKITLRTDGNASRVPSFQLTRPNENTGVEFAAIPLGHEFTSLVLALLWVGGHPPKLDQEMIDTIKSLDGKLDFDVYMSLSCHNCPDVVQALTIMAVLNPSIRVVIIDGALYQDEVERLEIMAVPTVYLNGEMFDAGRMELAEIVGRLDTNAAERDAKRLNERDPFDVLIVGGGPAGAAAGIYAARKGIRTGIAAERFGGQVNDTLSIENYISVLSTDGPSFASAMKAHVDDYEVDVMNLQIADKLVPGENPGDLVEVHMTNGGVLKSRTVILSTGARWRKLNVPGEEELQNKGVAYCPHCDGPLFKGKSVAVIGGGNSGVEAAIDLAGIVGDVTVLEFAPELCADAVLIAKLKSLPNVKIITNAQTTEFTAKDGRLGALHYKDRETDTMHQVDVEGAFIQIGLVPNTEWLKGTVDLTQWGEIEIDPRGATNVPGVFAAGDCTTVPYKQIVIAAGDGAKAALSAFDYLIRTPAPVKEAATV